MLQMAKGIMPSYVILVYFGWSTDIYAYLKYVKFALGKQAS